MLAIAYLSYNTGQSNISEQIFNQLNSVRIAKANQIESYFENIRNEIDVLSEDLMIINAVKDFKATYKTLENKKLADNEQQKLNKFYTQQYLTKLGQNNGEGSPVLEQYMPKNLAARYLQYQYIANNPNPLEKKNLLDTSGDPSDYNKIHSKYHPIFRNIYQKFGYYDIFLIDPSTGNIIYSLLKETDFGTNIFTGPYSKSNLAQSVSAVIDAKRKNYSKIVDFAPYKPSYDAPASFIATPIFEQSNLIGVLAFQISLDKVNQVMTGNKKWRKEGLGETGESYIVGADYTMRSMSRLLAENAEIYLKKAEKTGLSKEIIAQIKNTGTTILFQKVNTTAAKEALSGKEDTQIMKNYLDIPVISSYAPLQIEGLQWVIISEIALREAYASVYSFQKVMLIWGALIVLLITLASMILSYIFIRPINILTGNARKISGGQIHGIVKIKSHDEFGELSDAFNEMVISLQKQTSTIKEKNQENEKLLLSLFPDSVAKRLKNGEQDISDHVDNVTVLVSDIVGFTRLYETMEVNHV
ncbi:MAG TPA: HAMP domain-containing protein, partial [Allocoleopsis sp.]